MHTRAGIPPEPFRTVEIHTPDWPRGLRDEDSIRRQRDIEDSKRLERQRSALDVTDYHDMGIVELNRNRGCSVRM